MKMKKYVLRLVTGAAGAGPAFKGGGQILPPRAGRGSAFKRLRGWGKKRL